MKRLTELAVARIKPVAGKRVERFYGLVPGLCLRITERGVQELSLYYRVGGRQRRLTLGRYPDLSLAEARKRRGWRSSRPTAARIRPASAAGAHARSATPWPPWSRSTSNCISAGTAAPRWRRRADVQERDLARVGRAPDPVDHQARRARPAGRDRRPRAGDGESDVEPVKRLFSWAVERGDPRGLAGRHLKPPAQGAPRASGCSPTPAGGRLARLRSARLAARRDHALLDPHRRAPLARSRHGMGRGRPGRRDLAKPAGGPRRPRAPRPAVGRRGRADPGPAAGRRLAGCSRRGAARPVYRPEPARRRGWTS